MVYRSMVGARVRRKEDPRLITGTSMYVDDIQLAGIGHVVFVRSPFAHARITSIDTSEAATAPGVLGVFTNADIRKHCQPIAGRVSGNGIQVPEVEPLAQDTVRWSGEAVVAVVAESVAVARDAAELVQIDYEELPVVVDLEAGIKPDAPLLYDNVERNIAYREETKTGDTDAVFNEAAVTISQRILSPRLVPIPMEGRAIVAAPDPLTQGLTVWISNQGPHMVRARLGKVLDLVDSQIRVISPEVGGGFGAKIGIFREDIVVAVLAKVLHRPVKWIETRAENFIATNHGRGQIADIELASTAEGKITGLRLNVLEDIGGYPKSVGIGESTVFMAVGCYDIPNVDLIAQGVYTNKMGIGAYRGAGRPEAAYYIERAIDLLAQRVGKDPAEIRRINFISPDRFPLDTATGATYDSGEYDKALTKALEAAGYDQLRAEQEEARRQGRIVGIGLASYVEICGFGPFESSTVRVEPSGAVSVFTGISPHGQGQETTFAQIVADELGADFDNIVVHHGDTASVPEGHGTMGSRGLAVGGPAVMMSTAKVREKALAIAGYMMEAGAGDMEYDRETRTYRVKGAPDRALTLSQIAAKAYSSSLPDEIDPGLSSTDFFKVTGKTYPFGAHLTMVEIEPETGHVSVRRYVSVDDCGNVISPQLVDGQVHGGLAQGIGQALWEEAVYDDQGQLMTATLMDYALPHAEHFPMFELHRTVTPTPHNPIGAKGIGEAATIGSTPATVNAVLDALAPFGITHLDIPLTAPKIWQAIQAAREGSVASR